MPACPNCGRQTLRTKDWACQWCGYPLISRAFKLIDKTFKELQEERSRAAVSVDSDMDEEPPEDHEFEETYEPEPEPEPERKRKPESKRKPGPPPREPEKPKFRFFRPAQPTQRPAPEPRVEPQDDNTEERQTPPPRPINRPETPPLAPRYTPPPQPVYRPEPKPEPELPPPPKPIYQPAPVPRAEIVPLPEVKPEPVAPPPAASVPPPPAPEPPRAKPEIVVEPQAAYVPAVRADDIREGIEVTADDLDALFRGDKAGVNAKLTGKTIVLKGVVEKVFIREHLDIRYIMVTGRKKLIYSSRCTFNKDDAGKASHLNEGAEVVVRGKYDGYGKNVIFKDCQIV
jgi:hypothetical protein